MRKDGRENNGLREIKITRDINIYAEGSALIETGNTKVICTATIERNVPPFLTGTGRGWVTAEYSMLPRATGTRNQRDIKKLQQNARSVEIQRLIARALRMAVHLDSLGEITVVIDCDVIQADGGTRTASINGGMVALYDALSKIFPKEKIPVKEFIGAISVGIVNGKIYTDLCYEEDSKAFVDMNFVMNESGKFIEVQGTGENDSFSMDELIGMSAEAGKSITEVIKTQKEALGLFSTIKAK